MSQSSHPERVNIAVFIDFDNIEIGVKSTLGQHFDIGIILEALKERGEVVTKIAYADWTRAGEYSRALTQHAIRLVQRNLTPGGDKNGADINLALDALEMAFTHPHINAYVIVGGDSDFLSLVEKLKQYDKKIFVVGGRAFTSVILQKNCHEFIAYENLARKPFARGAGGGGRSQAPVTPGMREQAARLMDTSPITQAFPIVRRALKILADREVTPQTGLLKSTLLQLDSTFSERNYGASSFLDFAEKLAEAGLVQLKHAGRSVMVELNPGAADESASASPSPAVAGEEEPRAGDAAAGAAAAPPAASAAPAVAAVDQIGDNAAGVAEAGRLLAEATNARWPMYVRNVKQIFRAAGGFDERRYGFAGLMELLKALQREGFIRMERDRRGGLRVFQGQALSSRGGAPTQPAMGGSAEIVDVDAEAIEPGNAAPLAAERPAYADLEGDIIDEAQPPAVVDTTAELLGRAMSKRSPRTRSSPSTPKPKKAAERKPAARRSARPRRKAAGADE